MKSTAKTKNAIAPFTIQRLSKIDHGWPRKHISSCLADVCLGESKPGFAPGANIKNVQTLEMILRDSLSPSRVPKSLWGPHA